MDAADTDTMRRLLDASPDGYALVRGGEISWASAGLAALAGVARAEALRGRAWGKLFSDSGFGVPEGSGVVECGLVRPRLEPVSVSVDRVALDAKEDADPPEAYRVRDLRSLRTLEDEVLRSARRLHAINRELAAARERLQRDAEERDDLLTVLSHELRTPVTVITGYNRLLLGGEVGDLNEKQRHFLSESQKSCQRLDHFLGNLIEAAGKGVTAGPLEVSEGSMQTLFEDLAGMVEPLLRDRALHIEVRCTTELPRVRFDPRRIEQVLVNLVNNAARFAPPHSAIALEAKPASRGPRAGLEIAVSDRGPGIAVEERERVFEPYVQGESGRQSGGLGLGLAICRRIVEAHGGDIRVCAQHTAGARVVLWLPAMASPLEGSR